MPFTKDETPFPLRVLDHASSMLAYWDRDLRCCYANEIYQKWFGKPGRELLGTSLPDLLGPVLFDLNKPYILAALEGTPQEFERRIPGPDCIVRHSLARYHPDVVDGVVMGFIAEVSDVGVLKELEASLQEEIALKRRMVAELRKKDGALEAAQQLGQIGSWHWEIGPDITTWSSGLYRLFGYDPGRLPPTFAAHANLYTPDSWARLETAVLTTLASGEPYTVILECLTHDGGSAWLEARGEVERDSSGATVGLHGTVQDITGNRRLLQALQEQTYRADLAIAAAKMGMWDWNAHDDVVTLENARAADILSIDDEAPHAMTASVFFDAFWHEDSLHAFKEAAGRFFGQNETDFYFKGRFHGRRDGQVHWMECTGRAIGGAGACRMIGAFFDITERMTIKEALQNSVAQLQQSDARKGEFLVTLGHELRNCVSPLTFGMQLMGAKHTEPAIQKVHAIMKRQLAHMARLVDDIFDLRRLQCNELHLERAGISVNAVIQSAVAMCTDELARAGHELTISMPNHDIEMEGDFVRLTQILVNLLTNACKYTPSHGVIALGLHEEGPHQLVLSVRDNGIGLAPEALDRVFGLYVQIHGDSGRPNAGLGIGLHLVKMLVELHGGTVMAESAGLGKGCAITVRLPRSPCPEQHV